MPKVTDYSAATRFDSGDVIIKDGTGRNKENDSSKCSSRICWTCIGD